MNDPTDLGFKKGNSANALGLEFQYIEHRILDDTYNQGKIIAVKYRIKNSTDNVLHFGLNTEAGFSDGSGVYKESFSDFLRDPTKLSNENRLPFDIAPKGEIVGWQTGRIDEYRAKMKIKQLIADIRVQDDNKKQYPISSNTWYRHLKLSIIE